MKFSGSMVALVTPMKNGEIDWPRLKVLIERQIAGGTSVLVPCGTTGESATLSHAEHEEVIARTLEWAGGRVRVLAGAGSNNTAEAIKLHKFCEKTGVDGALHITPYYNKPTQAGLMAHFRAIAESSPLPVVLYNVPTRTGVNLQVDTVLRLAEIKTCVGLKDASGNLGVASEILAQCPTGFGYYSGEDALNYPLYALGAHGAISVTANVVPALCAEQYSAVQKGDFARAKDIHFDLLALNRQLFVETNPAPVKAALALLGLIEDNLRLPLVPISSANRSELQRILGAINDSAAGYGI